MGECFDDENAGHDWVFGPVTLKEGFVDCYIFDSGDRFRWLKMGDPVYEQKWKSVWEDFHNVIYAEGRLWLWFCEGFEATSLHSTVYECFFDLLGEFYVRCVP